MKSAIIILAILAVSQAFPSELTWGKVMIDLAELHAETNGPVDDLVAAIAQVLEDLQASRQNANDEFDRRTYDHEHDTKYFQDEIDNANLDISNSQILLSEVLYVNKQDEENNILTLTQNIADNERDIENLGNQRSFENRQYQERIEDNQNALDAVNEALNLIIQLRTGGDEFVQVNKLHSSFEKIDKHISAKSTEGEFVKILLELKAEEFADGAAVQKVSDLLLQIRDSLQSNIDYENSEEAKAVQQYTDEVNGKKAEITQMKLEISDTKDDLARTNEQIENEEHFVLVRKSDLKSWTEALDNENEAYDRATADYNKLLQQYDNEEAACNEATELLTSNKFSSSIQNRVDGKPGSKVGTGGISVN